MIDADIIVKGNAIPESWEVFRLGDCVDSFAGGTPLRTRRDFYENGVIPWVKSGEVDQRLIISTEERITEKALKESSARKIPSDSVLVALYGATAGKVGMLGVDASSNQAVLAISSKTKNLSNQFIYHYLKQATSKLLTLTQGSGQPNLSKGIIDSLDIPVPPISEQRKIADILSTVDDKIDVIDAQISKTLELKKGLMQRLLTKGIGHTKFKDSPLGKIPESWEFGELNSMCKKITVGFVGSCEKFYVKKDKGVLMLRTGNLSGGKIIDKDLKYVSVEFHEKNRKSQIFEDDILVARHGTNGQAVIVPKGFPDSNCLNIVIVRAGERILPNFLQFQFNSTIISDQIKRKIAGSTQVVINTGEIASTTVLVPSLAEQQIISEILSLVDQRLTILKEKRELTENLKKGLMQKLLTGEIRVNQINHTNDKPKSRNLPKAEASK